MGDSSYDADLGSGVSLNWQLTSPAAAVEYFLSGGGAWIGDEDGNLIGATTDKDGNVVGQETDAAAVTSALEFLNTAGQDLRYVGKTGRAEPPFMVTDAASLDDILEKLLRRHSTWSGKQDGKQFFDKFTDMAGSAGLGEEVKDGNSDGTDPFVDPLVGAGATATDGIASVVEGGSDDSSSSTSALPTSKAQDFIANVRSFLGNAFGSKLSIQVGDQVEVNDGDTYTFGNVTNAIEFGTGGYSYKQEDGDCYAEEYNYGNRADVNYTFGSVEKTEYSFGTETGTSYTFDAKATFSLTLGASTETEIELSARNSNSIWIGGKLEFDLSVGIEGKLSVAATATWELSVGITRTHTNCEHLTEIKIPQEEEISISGLKAYLTKIQNGLSETQNALALTNNALTKTNSALAHTDNALTDTDNALTDTDNSLSAAKSALSVSDNLLSGTKLALSISETSLSNTSLSGITQMS